MVFTEWWSLERTIESRSLIIRSYGDLSCGVNCRSETGIHTWSFTALLC
jgi:hypothetical protein